MTDHCDPMCPFLSCPRCEWQGGKPGLTSGNRVESDTLDPRDSVRNPGAWTNPKRKESST